MLINSGLVNKIFVSELLYKTFIMILNQSTYRAILMNFVINTTEDTLVKSYLRDC